MRYRVQPGVTVLWPDGETRAESEQVFDGFDSEGPPGGVVAAFAAMLSPYQQSGITLAGDAEITASASMPVYIERAMVNMGWVKPSPKPKAAKAPKAQATKKGSPKK